MVSFFTSCQNVASPVYLRSTLPTYVAVTLRHASALRVLHTQQCLHTRSCTLLWPWCTFPPVWHNRPLSKMGKTHCCVLSCTQDCGRYRSVCVYEHVYLIYVCIHVCMYVCISASATRHKRHRSCYACTYVCMHVCVYVHWKLAFCREAVSGCRMRPSFRMRC